MNLSCTRFTILACADAQACLFSPSPNVASRHTLTTLVPVNLLIYESGVALSGVLEILCTVNSMKCHVNCACNVHVQREYHQHSRESNHRNNERKRARQRGPCGNCAVRTLNVVECAFHVQRGITKPRTRACAGASANSRGHESVRQCLHKSNAVDSSSSVFCGDLREKS